MRCTRPKIKPIVFKLGVLFSSAIMLAAPGFCQTTTYIWNAASGQWEVAGNWTPNGTPSGIDSAYITNSGTVNVNGGITATSAYLRVGNGTGTTGTLNINGGTLVNDSAFIGYATGSSGALNITSGTLQNTTTLNIGNSGSGTLVLNAGANVQAEAVLIGNGATGIGNAVVDGTWNNSGRLTIGNYGTGTLTVDAGSVQSALRVVIGNRTNSHGTLNVINGGVLSGNDELRVGEYLDSDGEMNISGPGSTVSNTTGAIAYQAGSSGTVIVENGGSWNSSASLYVGMKGNATLSISGNDSEVTNVRGFVGHGGSAPFEGNGEVTITDYGRWTSTGELSVGHNATGTVTVSDNGILESYNGVIGAGATSFGTVTVGTGGRWTNTTSLSIGSAGNATLNINAGGTVENALGRIGSGVSGIGNVTVDGMGAQWVNSELHVGVSNKGNLVVSNGGRVTVSGTGSSAVSIATNAASEGTVTIQSGGQLVNNGGLRVGFRSKGTLNIDGSGSQVTNTEGRIGDQTGSEGSVTVTNGGSWTNNGLLYIGNYGQGSLEINAGTVSSANSVSMGGNTGADGTAIVRNGDFTIGGRLTVGGSGTASLTINTGGIVTNTQGYIGNAVGGGGTVTVNGTGQWLNAGDLRVGSYGQGSLTVSDSGIVQSTAVDGNGYTGYLAYGENSSGTVILEGTGQWINTGHLSIGHNGTASMTVTDNAALTNLNGIVGNGTPSNGNTVEIAGNGSWVNNGMLVVGMGGQGMMTVRDSGRVISNQGYIGSAVAAADGTVVIRDNGSWNNTGNLVVGGRGTGVLTIQDDALVRSNGVSVGTAVEGTGNGTLNLNGGVLETAYVRKGSSTGAFNFNDGILRATQNNTSFIANFDSVSLGATGGTIDSNGFNITASAPFAGVGGITKNGSGALTLSGASSYAGLTRVQQGTLIITRAAAVGNTSEIQTAANTTFELAFNNDDTLTKTITGSGNVVKSGSGRALLTATNTYSGATEITAGTLAISQSSAVGGTSGIDTAAGTFFELAFDSTDTLAKTISGGGSVVKTGSGTATLTGVNSYTGDTRISAGTLVVTQAAALGNGALVSVDSGATFEMDFATNETVDKLISGDGRLVKRGSATASLTAANTYTGTTAVEAGTLALTGAGSIALSESLTLANSGSRFDISGISAASTSLQALYGVTGSEAIIAGKTLGLAAGSFAGVVSGSGGNLQKSGTGALTLSGANTYTGATTIIDGTLLLNGAGSIAQSSGLSLTSSGTAFDIAGIAGTSTLLRDLQGVAGSSINTAGKTLDVEQGNFAGVIDGSNGSLEKSGTGSLTLSGINTYTGGTTVSGGTLALTGSGSIAQSSGINLAAAGTQFDITAISAAGTLVQTVQGAAGSEINIAGKTLETNEGNFAGTIKGANGNVRKTGAGTLTLAGVNSYSGTTTIDGGTLTLSAQDAIAASSTVALNSGSLTATADQRFNTLNTASATAISMGGNNLTVSSGTVAGSLGETANLVKRGSGLFNLNSNATISGNLSIDAGTFGVGNGNILTAGGNASFADGTTFALGLNHALAAQNVAIGNNVALDIRELYAGPETITLITSNNAITGNFGKVLIAGVEYYPNGEMSPSLDRFINNVMVQKSEDLKAVQVTTGGYVWNNTAPNSAHGVFNVMTEATVAIALVDKTDPVAWYNNGSGYQWDGKTLNKRGAGTLILTGSNTYTGATEIDAGTLRITPAGAVGGTSGIIAATGTSFDLAFDGTDTLDKTISGAGAMVKSGNGTATLTAANTYTGSTTVTGGTLALSGNGSIAASAMVQLDAGTGFDISAITGSTSVQSLNGAGNVNLGARTLQVAAGNYNGVMAGSGNLVKTGVGTLTLSGSNAFTGTTTVNGGTLTLAAENALASNSAVNVVAGALNSSWNQQFNQLNTLAGTTIDMNGKNLGVGAGSLGGNLDNTGIVSKTGTGTLVLDVADALVDASTVDLLGGTVQSNYDQRIVTLNTAGGTLLDLGGNNLEVEKGSLGGTLNAVDTFTKSGVDTLTLEVMNALANANTVELSAGTLSTTHAQEINTLNTASTSTFNLGGANLSVGAGDLAGTLNQIGAFTKTGTGHLTLNAGNILADAGSVNLAGGTLSSMADQQFRAFNSSAGTSFDMGNSDLTVSTGTLAGTLINTGTFNKIGNDGLSLAATDALAGANTVDLHGGTTASSFHQRMNTVNVGTDATLNMQGNDLTVNAGTVNGSLLNTGTLTKVGNGDLLVNTVTTVTGLDVQGGRFGIEADFTATGSATIGNNTTLGVGTNTLLTGGTVSIGSGTTLDIGGYSGTGTVTIITSDNIISGNFSNVLLAGNAVTPGISLSNYLNDILVQKSPDQKSIQITSGGLVWNNHAPDSAHGVFDIGTLATIDADLADNSYAILGNAGYSEGAYGPWDGRTLTKRGTGTLTLTGNNTYTGATEIDAGTLAITHSGAIGGTSGITVASGAAFELAFNSDDTLAKVVSGAGDLVKTGIGKATLTGVNTYNGATRLEEGALSLSGNGSIASSNGLTMAFDTAFDISAIAAQTTSLQSLNGNGSIALGDKTLEIGTGVYGGTIGGNGGIEKTGSGTLTLANQNLYGGATTVSGGTLILDMDNAVSLSSVIRLDGGNLSATANQYFRQLETETGSTLDMGANDLTLSAGNLKGSLTNTAILTKTDSGVLALNVSDALADVQTVRLGEGAMTASANQTMQRLETYTGTELDMNGYDLTVSAGDLWGEVNNAADFTKQGSDTLTLYLADALADADVVKVDGGTLASMTDQTFNRLETGAGTVLDMNHRNLTVSSGNLGSALADVATLTKTGSADLALNVADALAAATTVRLDQGTITASTDQQVNNLVSGTGTRFDVGTNRLTITQRLTGNGTLAGNDISIGAGAVVSAGHMPASPMGTLAIDGNLRFDAGAIYEVDVDPDDNTVSDLLRVTGTADLGGAQVRHVGLQGNYNPIGEWTILTADGGLGGTRFDANVDALYVFLDPSLIYDDVNDQWVKLKLSRNDISFEDVAQTPNQKETAQGLESLPNNDPLYEEILKLPGTTDVADVYDQLSGEIHASVHGALQDYDRTFGRALKQRLAKRDDPLEGYPLWVTVDGYRSVADAPSNRNTARTRMEGAGVSMGGERLAGEWTVGAAFRYGNNELKADKRHSKADMDSFTAGAYAGRAFGQWQFKMGATYGWHNVDTRRKVVEPSLAQTLKADYKVQTVQVFSQMGYEQQLSETSTFEPYVGLAWNYSRSESFKEKGGIAALRAKKEDHNNFTSTVGARVQLKHSETTRFEADLNWQHLYGDKTPSSHFNFSGGKRFTINGAPMSRDALGARMGAVVKVGPKTNLRVGYDGLFGSQTESHGGYLTLEYKF